MILHVDLACSCIPAAVDSMTTEISAALAVDIRRPRRRDEAWTSIGREGQIFRQEMGTVLPVLNVSQEQVHLGSPDQGRHHAQGHHYGQNVLQICRLWAQCRIHTMPTVSSEVRFLTEESRLTRFILVKGQWMMLCRDRHS